MSFTAVREATPDFSAFSSQIGKTYVSDAERRLAALVKPYLAPNDDTAGGFFFEAGRNHVGDIRDNNISVTGQDLDELAFLKGQKVVMSAGADVARGTDSALSPNRKYFDFAGSTNNEALANTAGDFHNYGEDATWIAVIQADSTSNMAILAPSVLGSNGGRTGLRAALVLSSGRIELQNKTTDPDKDQVTDSDQVTTGTRLLVWGSYKHSTKAAAVGKSTTGTAAATATFTYDLVPSTGAQTGLQIGRASTSALKFDGRIYMGMRLGAYYSDIPRFADILTAIDSIWQVA